MLLNSSINVKFVGNDMKYILLFQNTRSQIITIIFVNHMFIDYLKPGYRFIGVSSNYLSLLFIHLYQILYSKQTWRTLANQV